MRERSGVPSWLPTLLVAAGLFVLVLYASNAHLISVYWYQVIQFAAITAISALGLNLIYGFNGQFSLGHIGFFAIGAYGSALISKDYMVSWSGSKFGAVAWMVAAQLGVVIALWLVSRLRLGDQRKRLHRALTRVGLRSFEAWILVTLVVLLLVGAVLAVGAAAVWALHEGVLFALEALLTRLSLEAGQPVVFALAILTGGSMAALVAYLVGLPLLRLGSDYFGIATLGFAIMVYTALQNSDLVIETMKGARGMVGIPRWTTWGTVFGALVAVLILMRNLLYSTHGRAIVSVREDEVAARSMGIDVAQSKTLAFAIGGLLAGISGGLYAHLYGFLHPSTFHLVKGFDPLIIIVLGGLGSMTGTVMGSALFALLIEGLRVILPQGFEDWRFVIYPILLLLVMLLRQQGLLGASEWGWLRAPAAGGRDAPPPPSPGSGEEDA